MGILAAVLVILLAILFLDDMELTAVSLIIAIPLAVTYQLTDSAVLAAFTTFGILMLLGLHSKHGERISGWPTSPVFGETRQNRRVDLDCLLAANIV